MGVVEAFVDALTRGINSEIELKDVKMETPVTSLTVNGKIVVRRCIAKEGE